ncbi:MAG: EAL domain-containing protein [Burkholderiales bacterium]
MRAFRFRSLRTRIVAFFLVLLVLVQGIAFLLVNAANHQIARQTIQQELEVGERLFKRVLDQNRGQLEQGATLLSSDFAFREAIATNDTGTVLSVLNNHGARIGASVMMLVSLEHLVLADTLLPDSRHQPFKFVRLTKQAEQDGKSSGMVVIANRLYQLVVVPVLAPDPIAWMAMGFLIDDKAAHDLQQLTALDVSFLSKANNQPWLLHASTLAENLRAPLLREIPLDKKGHQATVTLHLPETDYEARLTQVEPQGDTPVVAVLQRSISEGLKPFKRISSAFLLMALTSIVLSLLGSIIIARNITRPINRLAVVAETIKSGNYTQQIEVENKDEIGALASSFQHMLDGISTREKEILRLAYEDSLTGLSNRAMFNDRLEEAVKLAKRKGFPLSIFMLDLDRFKYVNDTLGHSVGDQVLKEVALRLRRLLRASDTLARLGGDEFAIILPSVDPERVNTVAHKILRTLEAPIIIEDQPIDVSASIGIANYPEHGDDTHTLLRRADASMYAAKRNKTGFTIYNPGLDEHGREQLTLLGEIRNAVELNQLELYYQPKIDLKQARITAVEALVRWHHPERGFVPPNDFIPFAEQTGCIKLITRWVIDAAMKQCSVWHAQGLVLKVSINISARDLLDKDLLPNISAAIATYRIPAAFICFEVTESALMEDPLHARETLQQLHELGVNLSIDDYGTGYSSLAYIKKLAVDELKIDRAFVSGMDSDAQNSAIVRSTIELGHNLGMSVVAEGVETERELNELKRFGCDYAQGYWISKPLPVNLLMDWIYKSAWAGKVTEARSIATKL